MLASVKKMFTMRNIAIMVVVALFVLVGVYYYTSKIRPSLYPKFVENNEYEPVDTDEKGAVDIYFFFTTWCPHCKAAKPEWNKFKTEFEGKQVNGSTLFFKEVDCDVEEEVANKFEVEGYPTIKLVNGDQIIDLDAKPTYESLKQFVESTL